ncbi:hypothetical protein [Gemmatimonas sp. UBA7669]|uniref:hypothetical protein n=1 Tax=Gemmatimonas sp. UBA7669 TaxID=1946568 RepID=UPI0025C215F9|nr:hypothetical protein [Gemmatimonas sp. UBA7669]
MSVVREWQSLLAQAERCGAVVVLHPLPPGAHGRCVQRNDESVILLNQCIPLAERNTALRRMLASVRHEQPYRQAG